MEPSADSLANDDGLSGPCFSKPPPGFLKPRASLFSFFILYLVPLYISCFLLFYSSLVVPVFMSLCIYYLLFPPFFLLNRFSATSFSFLDFLRRCHSPFSFLLFHPPYPRSLLSVLAISFIYFPTLFTHSSFHYLPLPFFVCFLLPTSSVPPAGAEVGSVALLARGIVGVTRG